MKGSAMKEQLWFPKGKHIGLNGESDSQSYSYAWVNLHMHNM